MVKLGLRKNKLGVSTVIVFMLCLVLMVVVVSNVFLWNYQMNQLDWERLQEKVKITNVTRVITRSPWFVVQSEYMVNTGSHVNGTWEDTQVANDDRWETFQEETKPPNPPNYRLDINGTFAMNLSAYPPESVSTVEIQLRYNASEKGEKGEDWFLKAYNWTAQAYSDNGFNFTGHTPTGEWDDYAINLTDKWRSYVRDDGIIHVKFCDDKNDSVQTTINIDFLGLRTVASGSCFTFKNEGSLTAHLVALWIINSTVHQRYDLNLFVNSAETLQYICVDILPKGQYSVKVVTERGNIAVYS